MWEGCNYDLGQKLSAVNFKIHYSYRQELTDLSYLFLTISMEAIQSIKAMPDVKLCCCFEKLLNMKYFLALVAIKCVLNNVCEYVTQASNWFIAGLCGLKFAVWFS